MSLHPAVLLHTYQCQLVRKVCGVLCLDDIALDQLLLQHVTSPSCVRICSTPRQLPNDKAASPNAMVTCV